MGDSCHLLGIVSPAELERSPFRGALFEGFVAAEILKSQVHAGRRKELYYFRDQQGLEVDSLFPSRHAELWMVECKASKTVQPAMAGPLLSLQRLRSGPGGRLLVVHRSSAGAPATQALAPRVQAVEVRALVNLLAGGAGPAL